MNVLHLEIHVLLCLLVVLGLDKLYISDEAPPCTQLTPTSIYSSPAWFASVAVAPLLSRSFLYKSMTFCMRNRSLKIAPMPLTSVRVVQDQPPALLTLTLKQCMMGRVSVQCMLGSVAGMHVWGREWGLNPGLCGEQAVSLCRCISTANTSQANAFFAVYISWLSFAFVFSCCIWNYIINFQLKLSIRSEK